METAAGAVGFLASAAATCALRLRDPGVPLFSVASNLAFLPPAFLGARRGDALGLVAAAVLCELAAVSWQWHLHVDLWDPHLHGADLVAMVNAGVAAAFLASDAPAEALLAALLVVRAAKLAAPQTFRMLSMPALAAAALVAAAMAPRGRQFLPLFLLTVPLLVPVSLAHVFWGVKIVNKR